MSREASDLQEFERLKKLYPLFKFEWIEGNAVNNIRAEMLRGHSYCFAVKHGRLDNDTEMCLDKDHLQESISKAFMNLYPDLYISVHFNRLGVLINV